MITKVKVDGCRTEPYRDGYDSYRCTSDKELTQEEWIKEEKLCLIQENWYSDYDYILQMTPTLLTYKHIHPTVE